MIRLLSVLLAVLVLFAGPVRAEPEDLPFWAVPFSASLCQKDELTTQAIATSMYIHGLSDYDMETAREEPGILDVRITFRPGARLAIVSRLHGTEQQRLRLIYQPSLGDLDPGFFLQLTPDCQGNLGRLVYWDTEGRPVLLKHLDANLNVTETEDLNPPVPQGEDPGGVAVAHVDSGVNYLLTEIADRLARDDTGRMLGYDFRDDDDRPADLDPSRPAFFPIRHGTTVASVLLAEAPETRLVPIRHPGNVFALFADVVEYVANGPARIVLMPLGGYKAENWQALRDAAAQHPQLLFILSAGNDGRDIDAEPVYPAALKLENAIVVTSSDIFGRIAEGVNWGAETVDIAVPGERIEVIDHNGVRNRASGSSYAAPRVAALAARLAALHPDWETKALKQAILELASPLPRERTPRTKHGWIANPALEAQGG